MWKDIKWRRDREVKESGMGRNTPFSFHLTSSLEKKCGGGVLLGNYIYLHLSGLDQTQDALDYTYVQGGYPVVPREHCAGWRAEDASQEALRL